MKEISIGEMTFSDLQIGEIGVDKPTPVMDIPVYDDPDDITSEAEEQLTETAQMIKKQEDKLAKRMKFEQDCGYFFSICFEDSDARDAFLTKHKIRLRMDNHVFYEDIKGIFGE